MSRGRTRLTGHIPRFIYFYATISVAACADYGIPIEIKVWDAGRTPLAHMVDVTNGFGLKVLAEHNFLNDNNIAFSPYGLMGILVALYEGVDGESSYQIQRGMQLPWNRNVMRIGFRDIHRTLKTYFVPEEGFLAGLALNNENVTFNESYKNILRFYGFDLENDQIPTLIPQTNDTSTNMSTSTEKIPETTTADKAPTTMVTTESAPTMSTKEETTINVDAETINNIDPRGPTATTEASSAAPESESTTTALVTEPTTSQSTTEADIETSSVMTSASSTIQMTTTIAPSTMNEIVSTTTPVEATTEATSIDVTPPSSTAAEELANSENLSTREMTSINSSDSTTPGVSESSTITTMQMSNQEDGSTITEMTTETTESSSTPMTSTIDDGNQTDPTTSSTIETLERRKRSLLDFNIYRKSPKIDDYLIYRSFEIPVETANTDINTNKMFLVNGLRNVQVSYMHYDTILEHAYLPHLEASALRLPLDSERYYLLVVLPARGGGAELTRLLARMARESDLSDVYAAMRPRRVRAIVPSFTVKGHVTLTTDLQKLGIRDVFEPRQRDFTPLTNQAGVYVRSIEQAVSVAIRKYQPDQPDDHKKNRYVTNRNRVFFSATYPFLYFVMDSNIHVALMAGKMVDPLNTRIL